MVVWLKSGFVGWEVCTSWATEGDRFVGSGLLMLYCLVVCCFGLGVVIDTGVDKFAKSGEFRSWISWWAADYQLLAINAVQIQVRRESLEKLYMGKFIPILKPNPLVESWVRVVFTSANTWWAADCWAAEFCLLLLGSIGAAGKSSTEDKNTMNRNANGVK